LKYLFTKLYFRLNRTQKKIILTFFDTIILLFSCYLAFFVRLEFYSAWEVFFQNWIIVTALIVFQLGILFSLGIYASILLYSFHTVVIKVFQALSIALLLFLLITPFYTSFFEVIFPRLILFFQYFTALFFLSAFRFFLFNLIAYIRQAAKKEKKKIAIFGAGVTGGKYLQLNADKEKTIIFIDDKRDLHGQTIDGVRIIDLQKSKNIFQKQNIEKLVIAVPSLSQKRLKEVFDFLRPFPVSIETVYNTASSLTGEKLGTRNITIEDLIGRTEIQPDKKIFSSSIQGKNILITGAGGSIGTSLCQIIMQFQPNLIILLDNSEIALYKIENLLRDANFTSFKSYLCDIASEQKVQKIFQDYAIDTVYHTAAYKHVNIIEKSVLEGVAVNIFGTWNIAQNFIQSNAKNFVLISTDKAVRPTSVMGKTKKIAELAIRSLAKFEKTKIFTIVRFGNVILSSGSVVPRFIELINKKKTLMVTHEEATRYFMSLLEAASLVIQAGEMSERNEIFHLDMGEPVKIYDLAYNLIRLHGYRPHQDIKIEIGKLQPGEKIYEEDLIDRKLSQKTAHPKIFKIQESQLPREIFDELFLKLKYFLKDNDIENLKKIMEAILAQEKNQRRLDL
jgi:FlaA1/EpsC-like NDP-sugar epimerase